MEAEGRKWFDINSRSPDAWRSCGELSRRQDDGLSFTFKIAASNNHIQSMGNDYKKRARIYTSRPLTMLWPGFSPRAAGPPPMLARSQSQVAHC